VDSVISVAIEYSCGFLTVEGAPYKLAPKTNLGQALYGTTSTEEMPTAIF